MKFCLDAGHGGEKSGAVGPTGLTEAAAVMSITKHVGRGLSEAGHECIYTRLNDVHMGLEDRAEFANANGAEVFVSIHADGWETPDAHGFTVYTSPGTTDADLIATFVFESIHGRFPDLLARLDMTDGDPDKEAKFTVLMKTRMRAILIETGFITNPTEEEWLRDPGWRLAMAGAIVSGLLED